MCGPRRWPENINVAALEPDRCYTIGVHSWDAFGFGRSFATVRIYVRGELTTELSGVVLEEHDLWVAATVCRAPEATVVTPHYVCAASRMPCTSDDDCDASEACGLDIQPIDRILWSD